jgi:hypothetical protein
VLQVVMKMRLVLHLTLVQKMDTVMHTNRTRHTSTPRVNQIQSKPN